MKKIYLLLVLVLLFVAVTIPTLHTRIYEIDDQLMSAWYINLPGTEEHGYPDDIVDLRPWIGSNIEDLTITVDGIRNAELEAANTLKVLNVYGDEYEVKQIGDHWVLFRPEKSWTEFTWSANYRVSSFTKTK
jgi:hypothetical protein